MKSAKFAIAFVSVFLGLAAFSPVVHATSLNGNPVVVEASVGAGLTLNVTITDQLTNTVVPSMDFGELVRTDNEFRSKTFFKVLLRINSVGDPCQLTQTGTALTRTDGTETMPSGAYIVKPEYVDADNNGVGIPTGASVGKVATVVGTQVLYNDPTGSDRNVTALYTLSGDSTLGATQIIPLSQKSGSYSGTIQFTLTTV